MNVPLTHPAFLDVYFVIMKKFYVKEKAIWKLKVMWMHRGGWKLGLDKLEVTPEKMQEFIPYVASEQAERRRRTNPNGIHPKELLCSTQTN